MRLICSAMTGSTVSLIAGNMMAKPKAAIRKDGRNLRSPPLTHPSGMGRVAAAIWWSIDAVVMQIRRGIIAEAFSKAADECNEPLESRCAATLLLLNKEDDDLFSIVA
jgi:hypothetical protein